MTDAFDHSLARLSEYRREQAIFAETKAALQRRKRARLRLRVALLVAGRRPLGRP